MKILVTGNAGFIGFYLVKLLLKKKVEIIGVDNIDNYYDQKLKKIRLSILKNEASKYKRKYTFIKSDLASETKTSKIFKKHKPNVVIHLAAQAGVRYSLEKPLVYAKNNIIAFTNILENCKNYKVKQLIYASSSSIYGENSKSPFEENEKVDYPLQYYAATKRANELMAYAYSNLYNLKAIGIRFFTVYGPYGRPDMAIYKFTKNIFLGKKIQVHNYGKHLRDFTYVEDVVQNVVKLINCFNKRKTKTKINKILVNKVPHFVVNIANSKPIKLMNIINLIEKEVGKKSKIKYLPFQRSEVLNTKASVKRIKNITDYKNKVNIKDGIKYFVKWFKKFNDLNE